MPVISNVTDNCDSNLTITQSIPAGTLLALGNTTINITATDSKNNTVHNYPNVFFLLSRLFVPLK